MDIIIYIIIDIIMDIALAVNLLWYCERSRYTVASQMVTLAPQTP